MKRNGKTSAGKQRWRCTLCDASKTHTIDSDAKHLQEFLDWIMSREKQLDMPGEGRSFRRRCEKFWKLWPLPPLVDEIHRVVYVDGIYLNRQTVILIARSDDYVLGWYLAKSENSRAWRALLSRIAPPTVVVSDGGSGFEKARRAVWPSTRVQRCTFHAFCRVKRCTTSRPRLPAGIELYSLARKLLRIKNLDQAIGWIKDYGAWCFKWKDFLQETSMIDGRKEYTHRMLRKARGSLNRLISSEVLFTYLDPELENYKPLPATNNKIEGAVNAPLRQMLRDHRGMILTRRIKAAFWWCYLHTESPLSAAELLKEIPTDDDIDDLYRSVSRRNKRRALSIGLGDGLEWEDFHLSGPRPLEWD